MQRVADCSSMPGIDVAHSTSSASSTPSAAASARMASSSAAVPFRPSGEADLHGRCGACTASDHTRLEQRPVPQCSDHVGIVARQVEARRPRRSNRRPDDPSVDEAGELATDLARRGGGDCVHVDIDAVEPRGHYLCGNFGGRAGWTDRDDHVGALRHRLYGSDVLQPCCRGSLACCVGPAVAAPQPHTGTRRSQ